MLTKTDDLKAAVAHVATIKPALGFVRVRCTDAGLSVTGIAEDGTTVCGYTGARPAPGETAVMFRWAALRNFIKALPKGTATVEMAPAPGEAQRLIVRCDAGEFAILSTVGLPPVRRGHGPTRYSLALPDLTQPTRGALRTVARMGGVEAASVEGTIMLRSDRVVVGAPAFTHTMPKYGTVTGTKSRPIIKGMPRGALRAVMARAVRMGALERQGGVRVAMAADGLLRVWTTDGPATFDATVGCDEIELLGDGVGISAVYTLRALAAVPGRVVNIERGVGSHAPFVFRGVDAVAPTVYVMPMRLA